MNIDTVKVSSDKVAAAMGAVGAWHVGNELQQGKQYAIEEKPKEFNRQESFRKIANKRGRRK